MSVGNNIKTIRTNHGLSQEQFSEKIYCSTQTVSKLERNIISPNITTIKMISHKFGVPINEIISDSYEENIFEKIYFVSKKMLSQGVIPTIDSVSKNTSFSKKLLKQKFKTDQELLLFLIKSFDMKIQSKLLNYIHNQNEIIQIFINKCLPVLMQNESFLKPLYHNISTRVIIINYLKEVYSKNLLMKFPNCSTLEINIKLNIIIELIISIFTYNSRLHYKEVTALFNDITKDLN